MLHIICKHDVLSLQSVSVKCCRMSRAEEATDVGLALVDQLGRTPIIQCFRQTGMARANSGLTATRNKDEGQRRSLEIRIHDHSCTLCKQLVIPGIHAHRKTKKKPTEVDSNIVD